jgi:hypothetical protein
MGVGGVTGTMVLVSVAVISAVISAATAKKSNILFLASDVSQSVAHLHTPSWPLSLQQINLSSAVALSLRSKSTTHTPSSSPCSPLRTLLEWALFTHTRRQFNTLLCALLEI